MAQKKEPEKNEQKEINIREVIETLWNGKVIIAVILAAALIISGIISFFVLPKEYQAYVTITANPFEITFPENDKATTQNIMIENLIQLPSMTTADYLLQLKSPPVLEKTIIKLDLQGADGQSVNAGSLAGMISVGNPTDTSILNVVVTAQDPLKAAQIANALSECFIEYVTASSRERVRQSKDAIAAQLAAVEATLVEKARAVTTFWETNGDTNMMKGEIEGLTEQIVEYERALRDSEKQIATDYQTLNFLTAANPAAAGIDLAGLAVIIGNTDTASTADEQYQIELSLPTDQLSAALLAVEIDKIRNRLISVSYEKQALTDKISEMKVALADQQILLAGNEYKFNALETDRDNAQLVYKAYQERYNQIALFEAADIGQNNIIITSAAVAPGQPSAPNTKLNIIIAAFLGLLLGVFVVLFKDYWQKSK